MKTNQLQKNISHRFYGIRQDLRFPSAVRHDRPEKQEMDQILTQREKMTVAEIFERKGENRTSGSRRPCF